MLVKVLAAKVRTRTLTNTLHHWRASVRAVAAERARAVALLRGVAAERLAALLRPALTFWRRWAVVKVAQRAQVRLC